MQCVVAGTHVNCFAAAGTIDDAGVVDRVVVRAGPNRRECRSASHESCVGVVRGGAGVTHAIGNFEQGNAADRPAGAGFLADRVVRGRVGRYLWQVGDADHLVEFGD